MPPQVTVIPSPPVPGDEFCITVTYDPSQGPLSVSVSFDNGPPEVAAPPTDNGSPVFTHCFVAPPGAQDIDIVVEVGPQVVSVSF